MSQFPSFGICIPTRNQAEYIGRALSSAFQQTMSLESVVVSDDASTDHTAAVVETFQNQLSPGLRYVLRYDRSEQPLGIGGNFDRAVRLARGDFVVKLDSDDILEPTFVEVLSRHLHEHPKAGWAHCNVLNIHPDGSPIALAHMRKKTGFYSAADALPAYFRHNDTCHCVMLRKSAYEAVGGYRPEMKTCEDWLLWLEMLLGGWGYCFDARPLARMRRYAARPELMSRRRADFVASARFMVPRVEGLCRAGGLNGAPPEPATIAQFRAATARLCLSSGFDEADGAVRRTLFEAACEFHPSPKNKLLRAAGARLPAGVTRFAARTVGLPRRLARGLVQRMRRTATPRPA